MVNYSISKTPVEVLKELAEKQKIIRKKQAFSQVKLAEHSGVSLGSIKRFESTGQISLESFLKLLHILDRLDEFDNILNIEDDLDDVEDLFSDKTRR